MAVLLTGGTGKTSKHIISLLQERKVSFLVASRSATDRAPRGIQAVNFDWLDSSTYDAPFKKALPTGVDVNTIYLVTPVLPDPVAPLTAFTDLAVNKYKVKRVVLLAGLDTVQNGPYVGKFWQHLADLGVEYCVLRPTWFKGEILGLRCQTLKLLLMDDREPR